MKYLIFIFMIITSVSCSDDERDCEYDFYKIVSPVDETEATYVFNPMKFKYHYLREINGVADTVMLIGYNWKDTFMYTYNSWDFFCERWKNEYESHYWLSNLKGESETINVSWNGHWGDIVFDSIPFELVFYQFGFEDQDYLFVNGSFLDTVEVDGFKIPNVVIFNTYYHNGEMLFIEYSKDAGFLRIEGVVNGQLRKYKLISLTSR